MTQETGSRGPGRPADSFCFRLREARTGWNVLLPASGQPVADAVALLKEAPETLSMVGATSAVFRVALTFEPQPRDTVHMMVAVNEAGGVALAACPADQTRATCTAFVARTMAAAGRLWRLSFEQFADPLAAPLGKPLAAFVAERAGTGWSEEMFRSGVSRSLELGRFPVFLVVHAFDHEVAEASAHLRQLRFDLKVLSLVVAECRGVEVVMPTLLQAAPAERPKPAAAAEPAPAAPAPSRAAAPVAPPRVQTAPPPAAPSRTAEPAPVQRGPLPQWTPAAPASKPAPAPEPRPGDEEYVWDGTKPGIMSGKRPGPRNEGSQGQAGRK